RLPRAPAHLLPRVVIPGKVLVEPSPKEAGHHHRNRPKIERDRVPAALSREDRDADAVVADLPEGTIGLGSALEAAVPVAAGSGGGSGLALAIQATAPGTIGVAGAGRE